MENYRINKPGKHDIKLQLNEGEKMSWLGVIDARQPGEYELNLVMSHLTPDTFGRVVIKGVAENGARIKVCGLVKILRMASNTDSFLSMKVLLLDKNSTAVVEPDLEIDNNEVKAGHSASVGKIDEEQLFYLKSRGMSEKEAKKLIIGGFFD